MKRDTRNDSMYSGTPCDKCGGPTYLLAGGSIWCSAEDPHAGGHFVKRVAFERTPAKQAAADAGRKTQPITPRPVIETAARVRGSQLAAGRKPKPVAEPTFGGYDDFVSGDDR